MNDKHTYKYPEGYIPPNDWMADDLRLLEEQHRLRQLRSAEMLSGGRIKLNGKEMLNLCSNDYLGLLEEATTPPLSTGSGASRLVSGNHHYLMDLEACLADLHKTEACLTFGSGFLANVGVLSAVTGRNDVIFSDKLNHASIIDGSTLSRADHARYRHNDLEHLETLLKKHSKARRKLIVSDAIFSMDGDCADLKRLVELKYQYGAMLMIDEAHSGGTMGPSGAGLSAQYGLAEHIDIHVGTLSKAFACYGAYVCASRTVRDYLLNHARPLIYSTALPPSIAAAALQNTEIVMAAEDKRKRLRENSDCVRTELRRLGLDCGQSTTHIVPVILGSESRTLSVSERLQKAGIAAVAIRPPTVPKNAARIRLSIMASHNHDDLVAAVKKMQTLLTDDWRCDEA